MNSICLPSYSSTGINSYYNLIACFTLSLYSPVLTPSALIDFFDGYYYLCKSIRYVIIHTYLVIPIQKSKKVHQWYLPNQKTPHVNPTFRPTACALTSKHPVLKYPSADDPLSKVRQR